MHDARLTTVGTTRGRLSPASAFCLVSLLSLIGACAAAGPTGSAAVDQRSLAEYDLARDAFQNGKLREALEHVEKSLEIDADNAESAYLGAVILLGFCAIDEGSSDCRFDEAERFARRALDAQPDMRDARNTLGVVLVHLRKYDDAIAVLKPLANDILYPSPEKAWGNLGWAYLERGDVDPAIDALQRAVASQPLFCVGFFRLGLAYEKKGELGAAREALTRAVETDRPECQRIQDAFDARARVAQKQGLRTEARADFEKCRSIGSSTPTGRKCAAQLATMQ
jgi:Tfp pilus assembly protein PilF